MIRTNALSSRSPFFLQIPGISKIPGIFSLDCAVIVEISQHSQQFCEIRYSFFSLNLL